MSVFYDKYSNWLKIKCDSCGNVYKVYEGETDVTSAIYFKRENKWKTHKIKGKWVDFCPECNEEFRKRNRERFFAEIDEVTE